MLFGNMHLYCIDIYSMYLIYLYKARQQTLHANSLLIDLFLPSIRRLMDLAVSKLLDSLSNKGSCSCLKEYRYSFSFLFIVLVAQKLIALLALLIAYLQFVQQCL